MTYDDGPWIYTSQLLDILSSLQVPATFFVIGKTQDGSLITDASRPWSALVRRMIAEGHQVASHTFSHLDLYTVSREVQISELVQNENALLDVLGYYPTYFRCPYLHCDGPSGTLGLLADYGYHVISTNADTKDYMYDSPDQINNAKNNFANSVSGNIASHSYITLMHDVKQQTVVELTRFAIETARARGYQLVTVGECLGDDRANWYRNREGYAIGSGSGNAPAPTISTSTPSASGSSTPTTLITSARPVATGKVTIDATCGGMSGYSCIGGAFGDCCSQYGWW